VYCTGVFGWTADFDPGPGQHSFSALANYDAFLSKFTDTGFAWAGRWGHGTVSATGNSVCLGRDGRLYAAGGFGGTADFHLGSGVTHLTSAGQLDACVMKYHSTLPLPPAVTSIGTVPELSHVAIYPNPASSEIVLNSSADLTNQTFRILDALGRPVRIQHISSTGRELRLDIQDLSAGFYYVELAGMHQTVRMRLVKR
jgi:hypothetical protein